MVLINGVKYACERCIRGHRVTTCTHTDQPLTMIKPKGRPATQCQHCRDQRKMKNLHTSCTCGKKGKPAGSHLASCLCHKNSHCTCSSTSKAQNNTYQNIHHLTASEKAKKQSLISAANAEVKKRLSVSSTASNGTVGSTPNLVKSVSPAMAHPPHTNYVIDDVLPFDSANGFYDLVNSPSLSEKYVNGSNPNFNENVFNSSNTPSPTTGRTRTSSYLTNNDIPHDPYGNNHSFNYARSLSEEAKHTPSPKKNVSNPPENNQFDMNDYASLGNPQLSPTEIDLVDNMFPLFPLVGQFSFDDDRNKPLLALPDHHQTSLGRSQSQSSRVSSLLNHVSNALPEEDEESFSIEGHQPVPLPPQVHSQIAHQQGTSSGTSSGIITHNSSTENFTVKPKPPHAKTQQPKPLRPSTIPHNSSSSTPSMNGSTHYQPIRPKRPESVLSITSNSSNRSFDVNHNSHQSFVNGNGNLPNSSNSSAFPPSAPFPGYDAAGNTSSSSGVLGVDDSRNFLSDEGSAQHFGRTGLGSVFSSTNLETNVKTEREESADLLFGDNILNNDTLSTSSSFLNFPHSNGISQAKPPSVSGEKVNSQPRPSQLVSNSSSSSYLHDYMHGDKPVANDFNPIRNGQNFEETELNNVNNSSTNVIPPAQIPFEYDLSMPAMLDFGSAMFENNKSNQDFL
ncbi:uncharacterized protein CANTADRAFT_22943 [Suhomyces tanzawaensis NRRL Y-17324]|uniref:Copper-fist domain-containing protein n=1 Tax=Suhomyces tanzawaensis NRRL Y-17324 TaxID=984487 RepID=A0A1E4SE76_9ASCO|nr:uncharacterized protein CANTADRAFT_22943 [Suhomyces tanzawaensis NRRL Y-17324]ODV77824.1 hypothetical protein CANTADRAFT_22943 [Suhomyces tanzawaensis NRRL Y-17324]